MKHVEWWIRREPKKTVVRGGLLGGLVLAVAVIVGGPLRGGEPPAAQAIADHVLAATVGITVSTDDGGSFTGTGSVITPDGHIITSTSVVPPDATEIEVMFPGFVPRPATLVASEGSLAASLIKVEATGLAALPVARDLPPVGEIAYTASDVDRVLLTNGRASFSRGVVSGRYAVAKQAESAYAGGVIETTAAVNPGSDGGPLVDASGRLCGVISLGVSPLRWQGVAVPTTVLLDKFPAFASAELLLSFDPPAGLEPDLATLAAAEKVADLERAAALLNPAVVGIEVSREHPPEELPRISWTEHREAISSWSKLSQRQRAERFAAFANTARVLEVNQLLRRPAGKVTGLVISPEGHVLTSLFNVGTDMAFLAKATGRPRAFDPDDPIQKLMADPSGGLDRKANPITGVTVVLAGRQPPRGRGRRSA